MAYSNVSSVPLSIAVWLATDHYDHNPDPNHISATSLIKPIRQIVLASRVESDNAPVDLEGLINSRMGTAIHDSIEKAWTHHREPALKALGYPQKIIDKIKFNPDPSTLTEDDIPVYMEQRLSKEIDGVKISGKYDFIGEGRLEDFKSTSTYAYMSGSNDDKYVLQGSIYRWLNPQIITKDEMDIQFIFTDWSALRAMTEANKGYPQKRRISKRYPLMSLMETEMWVRRKITEIKKYMSLPDEQIPECTSEELWREDPKYKYYKNPAKTDGRSTKNFDNLAEAQLRQAQDGGTGIVLKVDGEVKACKYCPAITVCKQAKKLIDAGLLKGA